MTHPDPAIAPIRPENARPDHPPRRTGPVAAPSIAVAIVLPVLFIFDGPASPVRAQDGIAYSQLARPAGPESQRDFIRKIRRPLKTIDDRLSVLAGQIIGNTSPLRDRLVRLRIDEKRAEAAHLSAKLAREVAEIAVVEYKEGILVQDEATPDGEIKLAESDLERARDLVQYADMVATKDAVKLEMRLQERGRALALEAARWKKSGLREYTAPRQIKELEAGVAKARADERVKEAEWDRLKRHVDRIEKAIAEEMQRPSIERRSLALLEHAASLEGQVRARLDQLVERGDSDAGLQKEIRELTNQLEATVDAAEAAGSSEDLAWWKPRIQEAARPSGKTGSR